MFFTKRFFYIFFVKKSDNKNFLAKFEKTCGFCAILHFFVPKFPRKSPILTKKWHFFEKVHTRLQPGNRNTQFWVREIKLFFYKKKYTFPYGKTAFYKFFFPKKFRVFLRFSTKPSISCFWKSVSQGITSTPPLLSYSIK